MTPVRLRLAVIALVTLAGLGVALGILLTRDSSASTYLGSQPPVRVPLPAFDLRDWNGTPIRSSDLDGKVVLVTFLDSQCHAACPIVASTIGAGLRLLSAEQRKSVVAIAISSDPATDTPKRVESFLRQHHVLGRLHFVSGTVAEMRPVWKEFYVTSSFDTGVHDFHSAPVRVFDRSGIWVSSLSSGADLTSENLAHDVESALQSS